MDSATSSTPKQFGKYRIIAHLATGGMAEIYLASQTSLGGFEKLVVIKRILPHLAQEERFVEMFLDEARIAAVLNHPNVVQIFDLGRIDNQYYIAMEYLAGESLSLMVKSLRGHNQHLPPELAAGILMQAAEGLHHAHMMTGKDGKPLGIVHRDVSPQNIFVLYDGGVKVVDFGIARATFRSTHTRTGTLKGKYSYMSPEQILGEDLDARSDVFALGIVLWECLTSRKLYRQDSDLKLLQSITQEEAPSPVTVNPDLPPALVAICKKALARDRQARYQSAAELRTALAAFLKGAPREADTVAIGQFTKELFAERMAEKKRLIEAAQAADKDMGDYLFGDLNQYTSDTEHSIPRSTPLGNAPAKAIGAVGAKPRQGFPGIALAILMLALVVGGAAAAFFFLEDRPASAGGDGGSSGILNPRSPDGGAQALAPGQDAGLAASPADALPEVKPTAGDEQASLAQADASVPEGADSAKVANSSKPPKKPPKPPKSPRPKPDAGTTVTIKSPAPDKAPARGPPGKLRLTTSPWTEVFFEGRKLGQTPLIDVELPSGRIKLRVVNKEMGIDQQVTVDIKPGQKTTQRFNF